MSSSAPRLTFAQQLEQLGGSPPRTYHPDAADADLDGLALPSDRQAAREHYVEVGPSRLRAQLPPLGGALLSGKYEGKATTRRKIFDDDDDESEEEAEASGPGARRNGVLNGGESSDEEGEDFSGGDDEHDGSEDEDDDEEDGEEDKDEEGDEDEEEDDEEEDDEEPQPVASSSRRSLDPLAALKDSRAKDIEKGRAIQQQKRLFDSVLTMRITFQKALAAANKLSHPLPSGQDDAEGETEVAKAEALASLARLSDELFALRRKHALPGVEVASGPGADLGKRKRDDGDELEMGYWSNIAQDSLELTSLSRQATTSILTKWSNKIQAATVQMGGKQAGSSKFLQSAKGTMGVVEAIEAGLSAKRESEKTLEEHEEAAYRQLLREVIESRAGNASAGGNIDLTYLRREKKKKREEERGGSKGRKLRYTVHEKAQNFMVPVPLEGEWHEEQVDELFSSLLGGAGMAGGEAEGDVQASFGLGGDEPGDADVQAQSSLGGLRVF